MNRGAWRATVHGAAKVRHDRATKHSTAHTATRINSKVPPASDDTQAALVFFPINTNLFPVTGFLYKLRPLTWKAYSSPSSACFPSFRSWGRETLPDHSPILRSLVSTPSYFIPYLCSYHSEILTHHFGLPVD